MEFFDDTTAWREQVYQQRSAPEPVAPARVTNSSQFKLPVVAAALAAALTFTVIGPGHARSQESACDSSEQSEWARLAQYARSQGEDFDALVSRAGDAVTPPLAKTRYTKEDARLLAEDDLGAELYPLVRRG